MSADRGDVAAEKSQAALYGGQAVIEGVMIRGPERCALAVRRPDGAIVFHDIPFLRWTAGPLRRVPFVRGVFVLIETLVIGQRANIIATNEQITAETGDESAGIGGVGAGFLFASVLLVLIGLFVLVPVFASRVLEEQSALLANVLEGALRMVFFLVFIWSLGFLPDIKRMYGYHGAEHMTIHAHEAGMPLTRDAIRRFSPAHPRCGTSFLLTVVVLSIILYILLPREPLWFLIGSRIVSTPFIVAISYEFIRFTGIRRHLRVVRWIGMPNLWLQSLTTAQPDDEMIDVAVSAMRAAMGTVPIESAAADGGEAATEQGGQQGGKR